MRGRNFVMPDKKPPASKALKCPICTREVEQESKDFPFCSPRCRTIDLGRWAKGDYKISRPVEEKDLEDGE